MAKKPDNPKFDPVAVAAWESKGRKLLDDDSDRSWAMADWVVDGIANYGHTAATISSRFGLSLTPCKQYARSAERFPPVERFAILTYTHHAETLSLDKEAAVEILQRASKGRLTCDDVRSMVKRARMQTENARLKIENEALKKRLKYSNEKLAVETVERLSGRLSASLKASVKGYDQAATTIAELHESGMLDYLHGNARNGTLRKIRRQIDTGGVKCMASIEKIESVLEKLEGDES